MLTKDQSLEEIKRLVGKYEASSHDLTEEETKKDFILPLFRALNWDIENSDEVSAEEAISKKSVDYGFRIDLIPKFFVEAKALTHKLGLADAKQAINYSWLKSTTWAVLTNFAELKIYNAEWKSKSVIDKIFREMRYDEYISKFDKLWLLSKDGFLTNELDKVAEEYGKKRKRVPVTPVTQQLFSDMISWRQRLTKDIASKRSNMQMLKTDSNLDESVQRILDRLIFIKVCEDKQFEPVALSSHLREWKLAGSRKPFYESLVDLFKEFDKNYNSKLFSKSLPDKLELSDHLLNQIIPALYESKEGFIYDFAAIDADVLGSIYEQYLGYILEKRKRKAIVVADYGVRKKMGIFYTPNYVVDYIVRNTVARILDEGSAPKPIKVLDPACGSGSFLSKALSILVSREGVSTFEHKMSVLKNSIFGVDLDPKAVELTQLDLLLRILEKRKRLPVLDENIRMGNSLINDPALDNNALDWNKFFPEVMKERFDAVIGNPPYVQLSMDPHFPTKVGDYLVKRYGSSMGRLNTFGFFLKLGLDLLKEGGRLGFILPNTILTQEFYEELRTFILDSCEIERVVTFTDLPFKDAVVENVILILRKSSSMERRLRNEVEIYGVNHELKFALQRKIPQSYFQQTFKKTFSIYVDPILLSLKSKVERDTTPLTDFLEINQGIALKHDRAKYLSNKKMDATYKHVLDGRNIGRYSLRWDRMYLRYDINAIHSSKREEIFLTKEKLLFRRVGEGLIATLDDQRFYALNTIVVMNKKATTTEDIRFFLGLFNSRLLNFYYRNFLKSTKTVFSEIQARQAEQLPIKPGSSVERASLVDLVEKILSLNRDLESVGPLSDKGKQLQKEISRLDEQIDSAVYRLYELSDDEVKIVEAAFVKPDNESR